MVARNEQIDSIISLPQESAVPEFVGYNAGTVLYSRRTLLQIAEPYVAQ